MNTLDLSTMGYCSQTNTIKDRFIFEDKVYTLEDAVKLARHTFQKTQILQHALLPAETSTMDDPFATPFVTYHENIKAGTKVQLYREEYESTGWYSEVNGYCADACGFVGGSIIRKVDPLREICTKKVRQEEELCAAKLIESWKQNNLRAGALKEYEDVYMTDFILEAMMKRNHQGIDIHAWEGDYGHQDKRKAHVDGFIKIAVLGYNNSQSQSQVVQYQVANMIAGQSIEGRVGGVTFNIPFDTDIPTTLANFQTYVQGLAIFESVTLPAADTIEFTTIPGAIEDLPDFVFIATNGDGFNLAFGGEIIGPTTTVTNNFTITETVVQAATQGYPPIAIDKVQINSNNVIDRIMALREEIQANKPELLSPEFGGKLMVSRNVWNAIESENYNHRRRHGGDLCYTPEGCTELLGFNIVKMNYMPNNEMFFARAADLHVATDLFSDITEVEQGYDRKCGNTWFKHAFSIGFQISDLSQIAGTFCNRVGEFNAAMPCELQCVTGN